MTLAEVHVQVPHAWSRRGEPAMVPRWIAEMAYEEYAKQYTGQSFDRLHERGGFGVIEAMELLCEAIIRRDLGRGATSAAVRAERERRVQVTP